MIPLVAQASVLTYPPQPGNHHFNVFRVIDAQGRIASIHQGRGLDVEDVITELAKQFKPASSWGPYDLVIFADEEVQAVEKYHGDGEYEVIKTPW